MATATFLGTISLILATLYGINCQSYGTIPTTLARMESQLSDVSTVTEQTATLLDNHDQQLDTAMSHQIVQTQILSNIVGLLQKHDEQLDNMTHQHNQMMANLAALLQKHNLLLENVTNQQTVQNQILLKQEEQLDNMILQQNVQNQILDSVVTLLQNHDHQLENMTDQQNVQSQILSTMVSLQERHNQHLEVLTEQQLVQTHHQSSMVQLLQKMNQPSVNDTLEMAVTIESQNHLFNRMVSSIQNYTASHESQIDQPTLAYCSDVVYHGVGINYGIFTIDPTEDVGPLHVSCDFNDGGWIIFQRRYEGSLNFYKGWEEYKNGFGNLAGEHWLGLEKIHRLTRNGTWQLRIDLQDFFGNTSYAVYNNFAIGDESTYYRLSLSDYYGTAGDSLSYNAGMAFSTYDQDHDTWQNCAQNRQGAWWHASCTYSNLNGLYLGSQTDIRGMGWYNWKGTWEVLRKSEMKIRRI